MIYAAGILNQSINYFIVRLKVDQLPT